MKSGTSANGPVRPAKTFRAPPNERLQRFYTGGPYALSSDGRLLVAACADEAQVLPEDDGKSIARRPLGALGHPWKLHPSFGFEFIVGSHCPGHRINHRHHQSVDNGPTMCLSAQVVDMESGAVHKTLPGVCNCPMNALRLVGDLYISPHELQERACIREHLPLASAALGMQAGELTSFPAWHRIRSLLLLWGSQQTASMHSLHPGVSTSKSGAQRPGKLCCRGR